MPPHESSTHSEPKPAVTEPEAPPLLDPPLLAPPSGRTPLDGAACVEQPKSHAHANTPQLNAPRLNAP